MRFLVPTAGRELVASDPCSRKLHDPQTKPESGPTIAAKSGLSQKPFPATIFLRWEGRANDTSNDQIC